MTDKLYTRKKIKIPKFKKISTIKLYIYIIFFSIFFLIIFWIYSAFPIFKASCESAAGSVATSITNEAVLEIMEEYSYDELMNIKKDNTGKINFLELNTTIINQAVAKIVSKIQKEIDESPRTKVYINMGSVSGISNWKSVGPQLDIELETAGRITSKVRSEFENKGVNQTINRVFLDLNTDIGILTPYGSFSRNFETTVLLIEAIIIGEIPETYYDFDGIKDISEAYEMID